MVRSLEHQGNGEINLGAPSTPGLVTAAASRIALPACCSSGLLPLQDLDLGTHHVADVRHRQATRSALTPREARDDLHSSRTIPVPAASPRHQGGSSMPAARYRPLPSHRKSTRYVVARAARPFPSTRPTETRPSAVLLTEACLLDNQQQLLHSVIVQPRTPSVATDLFADAERPAKHLQSCSLQDLASLAHASSTWNPHGPLGNSLGSRPGSKHSFLVVPPLLCS